MKIDMRETARLLMEHDDILILMHASPDGDTVGGACALALALKQKDKRVKIDCADTVSKKFDIITENFKNDVFEEKYIVSVDVSTRSQLGGYSDTYGNKVDLAIDHHSSHSEYAQRTFVEGDSAACCEIIYLLIGELGVPVTPEMADALFVGVTTDTGCFRYSNVTKRTHAVASELIGLGARHGEINELFFNRQKFGVLELYRMCLENTRLYCGGKLSIQSVTQKMLKETGCEDSDIEYVTARSRRVDGVIVGVTVKEREDGEQRISVRTDGKVDASDICSHFGGGGHTGAAGCSLKGSDEEVRAALAGYIAGYLGTEA